MKKLIILFVCLYSCFSFAEPNLLASTACQQALPATDSNFCSSFKSVAYCHCVSSGLPANACQDMNVLYARMLGMYGTVTKACQHQKDTLPQNCMDDWKCYREGGKDSHNGLCSASGKSC